LGGGVQDLVRDDAWTVAAVAVIAFVLADVGHEMIGHGMGYLMGGGRAWIQTTTRIMGDTQLGDPGWRILDMGGPSGNLLFAALAWAGQRVVKRSAQRLRLMLWLVMAFSLFWAFGYLIYCGALGHGDWMALVTGAKREWLWRAVLCVAGIGLYRGAERLAAGELHWIVSRDEVNWPERVWRLTLVAYVAGGLIACAGAALDPHGPMEMLNSGAASSFAAAVGLLFVRGVFGRFRDKSAGATTADGIQRSVGWMIAAVVMAIVYIGVLGPGVRIRF
jgi:hypothetical protein